MSGYLSRRCVGAIVVMWAVATLAFFMLRAVPGDPIGAMLFDVGDAQAIADLKAKLGLDQPVYVQYVKWFALMLQGDLGNSIYGSRIEVSRIIMEALPRTLSLAFLSFIIAVAIAVPRGADIRDPKHTTLDHAVTVFAFLGLARLLARHHADHHFRGQPALAAGHRLHAPV